MQYLKTTSSQRLYDIMSEGGDYENHILTQLYSRKATRKALQNMRATYKKHTGGDLCTVIARAEKEMAQKIARDASQNSKSIAGSLRTDAFKLIDYQDWLVFCGVPEKKTPAFKYKFKGGGK